MSHLGERVTTLVDGQLGAEAAERALMHIAGCPRCREAVDVERTMKLQLSALGAPRPESTLMHRLLDMAGPSGPLPPRPGHVPGNPRPRFTSASGRTGTNLDQLAAGPEFEADPGFSPVDPEFVRRLAVGFGPVDPGFPDGELRSLADPRSAAESLFAGDLRSVADPRSVAELPAFGGPPALGGLPSLAELRSGAGSRFGFARGIAARPGGRRGATGPGRAVRVSRMVRVSRSSRNRMAAAMVGAVCLVGAGVAGGIANGGVADQRVVPPVDSFVLAHSITETTLPFEDQTVLWGSVGSGR